MNPSQVTTFATKALCATASLEKERLYGQQIAVLQQPLAIPMTGYSCKVTSYVVKGRCGTWSHFKLREPPSHARPVHISQQECREMVQNRKYTRTSGTGVKLELNKVAYMKELTYGSLNFDIDGGGWLSCEGEKEHITTKIVTNSIVMVEYHVLIREQNYKILLKSKYTADRKNKIESQTDMVTLPCHVRQGSCKTGDVTYVLDLPTSCHLTKVRTFFPKIKRNLLISHQHHFVLNETEPKVVPGCEQLKTLKSTSYNHIYVANKQEVT